MKVIILNVLQKELRFHASTMANNSNNFFLFIAYMIKPSIEKTFQ